MGIYIKEDKRTVAIDLEGGSVVVALTHTEDDSSYSYRYYISAEEMADIVNERLGIGVEESDND